MVGIVEGNTWEPEVYQLETADVVMGGENGIDNLQAKQLAARTQYLKLQQEGHAAAADPHPQYMTTAESTAAIAAAVAALVNSSPAALDTLAELATALGNDPNYATTITNALAGKQPLDATLTALAAVVFAANKLVYATGPDTFVTTTLSAFARTLLDDADAAAALATLGAAPLDSPAMTGAPTAPTAAAEVNTNQLATTAFVQAATSGYLNKAGQAGGTLILTAAEATNSVIRIAGALTSNLEVIMPTTFKRLWAIYNATSGAFSVTVKTAAGTGVTIAQGKRNLVYTEGTNILDGFNDFESAALTGTPTTPTAAAGTNTTQIASTAFVHAAITALIAASPAALDTLNELAAALGDDPNFATTMTNALAGKAALAGLSTQLFSCANATAATHSVNRQFGDGRYAALAGLATQVFSVAAATAAAHAVRFDQVLGGYGQTPTDVTASRAVDAVYTNNTGSAIYVSISGTCGAAAHLNVDGAEVARSAINSSVPLMNLEYIVPNGSTYQLTRDSGAGITISKWSELR